jgi:hypothetical protein
MVGCEGPGVVTGIVYVVGGAMDHIHRGGERGSAREGRER